MKNWLKTNYKKIIIYTLLGTCAIFAGFILNLRDAENRISEKKIQLENYQSLTKYNTVKELPKTEPTPVSAPKSQVKKPVVQVTPKLYSGCFPQGSGECWKNIPEDEWNNIILPNEQKLANIHQATINAQNFSDSMENFQKPPDSTMPPQANIDDELKYVEFKGNEDVFKPYCERTTKKAGNKCIQTPDCFCN